MDSVISKDENAFTKKKMDRELKIFRTNTPLKNNKIKLTNTPLSDRKATQFPSRNSAISDRTDDYRFQNSTIQHQSNKLLNSMTERSSEIKNIINTNFLIDFTCFFNSEIKDFQMKVNDVLDKLKIIYILKKNFKIICHRESIKFEIELISISKELSYIKMRKIQGSSSNYINVSQKILIELSIIK